MAHSGLKKRCWCEHLERWHSLAGIRRWCAKMELIHPQFNFMPRHEYSTEIPEELKQRVANAIAKFFDESSVQ